MQIAYRCVSIASILIIPTTYIGIYISFVLEYSKAVSFLYEHKTDLATATYDKYLKIDATLGYLALVCNLFSCLVMVLVIRLVKKITERVDYGQKMVEKERKFSQTMTVAHIGLVLGYTVISIMAFNIRATGAA